MDGRGSEGGNVPLLDFVEAGEERDGDEDDDGLLAVADFELKSGLAWFSMPGKVLDDGSGAVVSKWSRMKRVRKIVQSH